MLQQLWELQDIEYANLQRKSLPNIEPNKIIGVRVPEARKLAKQLIKEKEGQEFLQILPHEYYDENMLHGLLVSEMKDYDACIQEIDKFLPYVDNWAVCDVMSPRVFKNHLSELMKKIKEWTKSEHTYTCRFGIKMLMNHFLDDMFQNHYLKIPAQVHSNEYYVQMMIAWFFATALAKQWDATIPYIEAQKLDVWVHNKTIQKARESYCITKEEKEYLLTLKRK